MPEVPPLTGGKQIQEDATAILPANKPQADWQPINVVAGRQQTPTNMVPSIKPPSTRPSGERKRENLRPSGYLTPQRRAQMVALLTICIAICIGVLITLLLVGS